MSSKIELLDAWEQRIGGWTEDLMKDGLEEATLRPLCVSPDAALAIVEHVREWDSHMQRKIAATIVGLLGEAAPPDLLAQLFDAERARARGAKDAFDRVVAHSVVEDIVFAATRWCRVLSRRAEGIALLEAVVDRSIDGESWNTASYAMTSLIRHDASAQQSRLERFHAYAATRKEGSQERTFSDALRNGKDGAIESALEQKSRAAAEEAWPADWLNAFAEIERLAKACSE